MTDYRRKPTPVKAWQFQIDADRPAWVNDYRAQTPMGPTPIANGLGTLLVPTKTGATLTAEPGEWLVLDDNFSPATLSVVKPDAFDAAFEAVGVETEAAPEPVVDAAPAASTSRSRTGSAASKAPAAEPAGDTAE